MKHIILNPTLIAAAALLASCSTSNHTPRNSSRAEFLDQVWVTPELRGQAISDSYNKVYFAPVTVSHLKDQTWWNSQNTKTRDQLEIDAKNLATFTHRSFVNAANQIPGKKILVVSNPGPGTLIIESSIVELVPSKAFWNSAASAAGFVVPGAGILSTFGKGSITIEGRLRDAASGKTIATFRDHSSDKTAVVNVNSFTWYRGSEANIDELALRTAQLLNSDNRTTIKESSPIKLIAS